MKTIVTLAAIVAVAVATALTFGCASTRAKRLSGGDFLKQAGQTDVLGSFAWTSYIGSTQDRAYLEYGHPAFIGGGLQVTVYWTFLSELPSNIVAQLKAGERPWTNAMDRISQPPPRN